MIDKTIGDFKVLDFPSTDFGEFTWISLTGENLSNSAKSLITIGSKIQNTNMIWDGTTTIHDNWGKDTTIIYPLDLKLELNIHADSIKIFPLDNLGKENAADAITLIPSSPDKFVFEFDQNMYKTLWFGIKKFGDGVTNIADNENEIPDEFELMQNYPNPFNPSTTINFKIPVVNALSEVEAHITLKVYDILGREIKTLINEKKPPGTYKVTFDAAQYPSGIYFYTLRFQNRSITKKMILLK